MTRAVRTVMVGSRVGLHARPASIFVQAATATAHSVTVTKPDGHNADATSILSLLALGVAHGETIVLTVEGENAERIADDLEALLASDLDAPH